MKYSTKLSVMAAAVLFLTTAPQAISSELQQENSFDVVIMGGGLSGLTCAQKLSQSDPQLRIAVLEARDRLGGRTWTQEINGQLVECGGEFLDSQEDHPAIHGLVQEMNLGLEPVRVNQTFALKDEAIRNISDLKGSLKSLIKKLSLHTKGDNDFVTIDESLVFSSLSEQLNLDKDETSLINCIMSDENGIDYESSASYSAHGLLNTLKKYKTLCSVKSVPLLGNFLAKTFGGILHYRIEGGTFALIDALQKSISDVVEIHNACPIQNIRRDDQGLYNIECDNNGLKQTFFAKKMIVSAPFSTLRSESKILDDESLNISLALRMSIDTMTYGTNSKIIIPAQNCSDITYGINMDNDFTCWGTPVGLTCLLGGELGLHASMDAKVAKDSLNLANKLSLNVEGEVKVINWGQDPYSKGSYKGIAKGEPIKGFLSSTLLKGMDTFADPSNNNTLFFIGEHTCLNSGYMNSAVHSGLQVAKFINENSQ